MTKANGLVKMLVVALCLILPSVPDPSRAHAVLIASVPADGEALPKAPGQVILQFNARIEQRLARVRLVGPNGQAVPLPRTSSDRSNRVTIGLPPLPPGEYQLYYRVVAADGHATPGRIRFQVKGGKR